MKLKRLAIVTSASSWFVPYAKYFVAKLRRKGYAVRFFNRYEEINNSADVVFILSYFRLIKPAFLKKHTYNLVVHESQLPQGRGWAPFFWQISEGKNKIPVVLFEATEKLDRGGIFIRENISLEGYELNEEIRKKQAEAVMALCLKFLKAFPHIKTKKQVGRASYYRRRIAEDSKLNINKSIKEQFNLLRIVHNEDFPAFFIYKKQKYILKIYKST